MRYILVANRAFRLGLDVFESVGPFDSVDAAMTWYDTIQTSMAVPLPSIRCLAMADAYPFTPDEAQAFTWLHS